MSQVVIKKIQRLVGSYAGQPEGELGQLHGHWIDVHSIDTSFDYPASPIGDFGLFLRDTRRYGHLAPGENFLPGCATLTMGRLCVRSWAGGPMLHYLVRQPFSRTHEKMAAPHGRIHNVSRSTARRRNYRGGVLPTGHPGHVVPPGSARFGQSVD